MVALMLHGQPGGARDWQWLEAELRGRLPTVALDRPGYDGRTAPGGLASSGAAALRALDDHGAERAIVVGHSFGAAVAAWLAVHHPERVASLVLVAPAVNSASLSWVDRLLGAPVIGRAASAAMLNSAGVALGWSRSRRYLARAFSLPDELLSTTARRLRSGAILDAFVVEQRALLSELPALDHRLGEIRAPTTIVIGTADAVVPPDAARLLARQIPGARLVELAGAHHVLPAEYPGALAELILSAAGLARNAP